MRGYRLFVIGYQGCFRLGIYENSSLPFPLSSTHDSQLTTHDSPLTIMFQRQAREPFPVRNILLLAAFILGCLLYVVNKSKEEPAPPPDVMMNDE